MHTRIQTWFSPASTSASTVASGWPGRWTRPDCATCAATTRSPWLEDLDQAQALLDQQAQANWPQLLDALAHLAANPRSRRSWRFPCHYYWSVSDGEWASDVLFPSPEALATVYPRLLRYAITTFTPVDVMRFLGQPVPASGKSPMPAATRSAATSRNAARGTDQALAQRQLAEDVRQGFGAACGDVDPRSRGLQGVPTARRRPPGAQGVAALQGVCDLPRRGRGQPGGQRAPPGGADRSPGHDTAAATGRAVVPAGRAPAPPPQPSRPTDRVRRRRRRVWPSPAAADLPPSKGSAPGRGFHAGRGFRAGIGGRRDPRPASAADGAASASAADAPRHRRRRPDGPRRRRPKGVALGPGGCGR